MICFNLSLRFISIKILYVRLRYNIDFNRVSIFVIRKGTHNEQKYYEICHLVRVSHKSLLYSDVKLLYPILDCTYVITPMPTYNICILLALDAACRVGDLQLYMYSLKLCL